MATRPWRWFWTAGMMLAAGLAGFGNAQEYPPDPQQLPAPRLVEPSALMVSGETASGARCRTPVFHSLWHRAKNNLERWFVSEEPDPFPAGQSVYQTFGTQVNNGIAARMILYDFDFEAGRASLNPRGQDQLSLIAAYALRYPYPVIIERNRYQPKLAEERQRAVVKELKRQGIPLSADRIVVGAPLTAGLSGVEAFEIYQNLIEQTRSKGISGGQGGTSAGTTPGTSAGAQPSQTPASR